MLMYVQRARVVCADPCQDERLCDSSCYGGGLDDAAIPHFSTRLNYSGIKLACSRCPGYGVIGVILRSTYAHGHGIRWPVHGVLSHRTQEILRYILYGYN